MNLVYKKVHSKCVRRVYRYILSQNWGLQSILNTCWWDQNLKKINHSEGKNFDSMKNY